MIIKVEASGQYRPLNYAFEFTTPTSGAIEIQYLSDKDFLFDPINGYVLSGEPTSMFVKMLNKWDKESKNTWRYAVADVSYLDARPLIYGNLDILPTKYDIEPGEELGGIGDLTDLQLIDIQQIKEPVIISESNTAYSGTINIQEAHYNVNNYFKYFPEMAPGYFSLSGSEYYLYPTKVSELLQVSGDGRYYLSGSPDSLHPIIVTEAPTNPILPCNRYPFDSGVFPISYSEFSGNLSPLANVHRIEPLSGNEYIPWILNNEDTSGEYPQFSTSGNYIVMDQYSGQVLVTYGKDTDIYNTVDLSPLTDRDTDRVLMIREGPLSPAAIQVFPYTESFYDDGSLPVPISGTYTQYPTAGGFMDFSGTPTKYVKMKVCVTDGDGVVLPNANVAVSIRDTATTLTGAPLSIISRSIVSRMDTLVSSELSGVTTPTNLTLLPLIIDYGLENDGVSFNALSGDVTLINGYAASYTGLGNAEMPLVAALYLSGDITTPLINNALALEHTYTTDSDGSIDVDLFLNSVFGIPHEITLDFTSGSATAEQVIGFLPTTYNTTVYSYPNGPNIDKFTRFYTLVSGTAVQLDERPLAGKYGVLGYDPTYYLNVSGDVDRLSGTNLGLVYNMNNTWVLSAQVSGTYAIVYDEVVSETNLFDKGFTYVE